MEKDWRIPTLTRSDGEVIKVWEPRELDYVEAEYAMKLFNEKDETGQLKQGIRSTHGVELVIRNDRGSKSYNQGVARMLGERDTIETQANEKEMDDFLTQAKGGQVS